MIIFSLKKLTNILNSINLNLKEYKFKNNFRSFILRIIRNFIHNFIFFLSLESKLYSVFWVKPNLRLRNLFKLKI